jgi:hypothetical protein
MESEDGVEFAERVETVYDCAGGHVTVVPFSVEADIPALWQCRCGAMGGRRDAKGADLPAVKKSRSHWDMLMERRSVSELEQLLDERLALLRAGRGRAGR